MLDVHGSLQLLNSSHVRERDKALLRSIMVGGVSNGLLLGRVRSKVIPCRFCGAPNGDVTFFGECTFPPLVEIRESPEFHDLMRMDKGHWPRCLLLHGWLPMLSGVNGASPWAASASESAGNLVEAALGCYSSGMITDWSLPDEYDRVEVASSAPDHPNVWSDGSLVLDQVTGVSSSGAGFFAHQSVNFWGDRRWVILIMFALRVKFSPVEVSVLFLGLSSLFRELRCRVSFWLCSPLVRYTWVLRTLGLFVMSDVCLMVIMVLELVKDGDILLLIERMLHLRGLDTVQNIKVNGHADEGMVLDGQVREVDRLGNNAADEAADFGRSVVSVMLVIDARRNLSGVCSRWYPVVLALHRFFIAISRAVVNHDGGSGTAPDPLVWSAGALPKRRRLGHAGLFFAWATLMVLVRRFTGFVVLVLDGQEFDQTEKLLHTSRVSGFSLVHGCGRGCVLLGILVFPFLITRGGVVIRMTGGYNPAQVRTGVGLTPWALCKPTSPGLHVFN